MSSQPSAPLVWLITGANSGFGLELSLIALKAGHTVITTARNASKFPSSLKEAGAHLLEIEITAPWAEIQSTFDRLVGQYGHIDVLVNNAGFAQLGAVEEVDDETARYQLDVNFFGLLNFTRAALPHMRARKSGVIVQLSSIGGLIGGHGAGLYGASKFAVEGLSETLYNEMRPFGVRTHIIVPGFFRTAFLQNQSQGRYIAKEIGAYGGAREVVKMNGAQYGDPAIGVQRIFEVVTGTGMGKGMDWELRILLGFDSIQTVEAKTDMLKASAQKMKEIAVSTTWKE